MTALRDARLQRALAFAPDANLRAPAGVADAVRRQAHAAVAGLAVAMPDVSAVVPPAGPMAAPWWRRLGQWLWNGPGPSGRAMPWNAAFASVLLAGVVTLLWHDREIPGAAPERAESAAPVASPVAPVPVPAAAPPAVAPPAAPSPAAPSPAAPAKDAAPKREARAAAARPEPVAPGSPATPVPARGAEAAPPVMAPPPAPVPAQADESRRSDAGGALSKSQAAQAPAAELRQPAPAMGAAGPGVPGLPAPSSPSAARMATPAPAAAPAPAPATAAAPAAANAMRERQAFVAWTSAVLSDGERTVAVDRAQSGGLAARIARVLAAPSALAAPADTATASPQQRIALLQEGQPMGLLELSGQSARWTPAGGTARALAPDAPVLQALRDEIARLMPR